MLNGQAIKQAEIFKFLGIVFERSGMTIFCSVFESRVVSFLCFEICIPRRVVERLDGFRNVNYKYIQYIFCVILLYTLVMFLSSLPFLYPENCQLL